MQDPRGCRTCDLILELGDTAPLAAVYADLEAIEALDREIGDLTAVLRARLTPEQFKLVWALRDAVERLEIAEGILRERQPAGGPVQPPRACAHAK
jgi:hypothetical protein